MGEKMFTTIWSLAISLAVVAGCGGESPGFESFDPSDTDSDMDTDTDSDTDSDTDIPSATVETSADTLVAADPRLEGFTTWPLRFSVESQGYSGLSCGITLGREDAVLMEFDFAVEDGVCGADWTGRDEDGDPVAPGVVTVAVTIFADGEDEPVATVDEEIEVLRLGMEEIQLGGDSAGTRIDLLWPEKDGEFEGYWELVADDVPWRLGPDTSLEPAGAVLDLADGSPRPLPQPWTDVKSPPLDDAAFDGVEHDTFNLPTAWVEGSLVTLEPTFTTSSAQYPDGLDPALVEIRLVAPEGTSLLDGDVFAHGETAAVVTDDSPIPSVDRFESTYEWTFEARRTPDGQWQTIPGGVTTTHALYGLVDEPTMGFSGIPHRAWVDVVDTVTGWVGGTSDDATEVAGILVHHVFDDMGLVYDDQNGACTYTEYPGWNFSGCRFDLAAFQRRDFGSVINCSDAAAILSTYANMVGVDFNYHILQNGQPFQTGFDLNYIVPIGFTEFDETPFAGGGGGFSYHAVVGPASGSNIFDATLLLDGDGTPTAPPHTVLYPDDLTEGDYLFGLSSEWNIIDVSYDEKVVLQQLSKSLEEAQPIAPMLPGMDLLIVRPRFFELDRTRFVYGAAGSPRVLVDVTEAAGAAGAIDALHRWRRTLAGPSEEIAGLGDIALGGRSAVGFTSGNRMIVVRSVDSSIDALEVAVLLAATP